MSPETSPRTPDAPVPQRLESLDTLRGMIMLALLCGGIFESLKGHPTWGWLHDQTEHVAWEGCVFWDLIQPAFMLMVGVAMPFAFAARTMRGETWTRQLGHALLRASKLLAIGIWLDHIGASKIQIGFIRVLQQIAFGYLAAFFVLGASPRRVALTATAILVGYHCLWVLNPYNGPGGPWAPGNENLGSVLDRWLLGRNYLNLYVGLNAVPSTATILFGVLAGKLLHGTADRAGAARRLLGAGLCGVLLGLAASPWFPLIKRIWTPSFAVYSGGWVILLLGGLYLLIDVLGIRRWTRPFVVVGANSIAAYVLGNAFRPWFNSAFGIWSAWLRLPLGDVGFPILQSALFAAWAWLVLYWLHRRKIFLKV